MNKSTSLYLDFLRVLSAFGVVLVHTSFTGFSNLFVFFSGSGSKLVMIFFVLSGYLISFTVDKKNKGSLQYLIDRLSRLYSVILPALLLTFILDSVGKHYNPGFYLDKIAQGHQLFRYLINGVFLSQIWGFCTQPSTNVPFWSLSYEFWYYMLFGAWVFLKGAKKIMVLIFICALIGPKILLLFPVWFFGVLAYKNAEKVTINRLPATMLFCGTLFLIILFSFFWDFSFFPKLFIFGKAPLFFSSEFLFDWILGAIVAVNIWSFNFIGIFKVPGFIDKAVRKVSSITFSLYLYHYTILVFIAALISYNKGNYFVVTAILCCLVIIVAVLSEITEKQRSHFKFFIEKIFLFFGKKKDIKIAG